jgi:hypothetical protein
VSRTNRETDLMKSVPYAWEVPPGCKAKKRKSSDSKKCSLSALELMFYDGPELIMQALPARRGYVD